MANRDQFKQSARNKIAAAEHLLDVRSPLPIEAAYMCIVALECALKRRILSKHGFKSSDEINEEHKAYSILNTVFTSKEGHNLQKLAIVAGYDFLTKGIRPNRRMFAAKRPYSLRYNEERLSVEESKKDFTFAKTIVTELEYER